MTGPVAPNFRGMRALIAAPPCASHETLATTLRRLGLDVAHHDPADGATPPCDVLFFDADEGLGAAPADTPLIALIGLEAPSRLLRAVRHRCAAYLMKPIRPTGIFTALFIALNEQARRRQDLDARTALARRVSGRRDVIKAVLWLMREFGVDDDEAFRLLRAEAMRRRLSVEMWAGEFVHARNETPTRRALGRQGDTNQPNRR
jgi:hypothetical protein